MEKETQKITSKTKEQILRAKWEDLTSEEKMLQSVMQRHDMTLEKAIETLEMLP